MMNNPSLILLVDDEPAVLYTLGKMLTRQGYATEQAVNGAEALEKTLSRRPDLIILDIRLPDMTGIDVLRQLRANPVTRGIPVIMHTGYPSTAVVKESTDLGAADFLIKPSSSAEIRFRVQTALVRAQAASKPPFDHHIFLSYSRSDTPMMQRIRDDLRVAKFKLWVDEENLEPGTMGWELAIGQAIRGTGCLVVILSPDAEQSTWVARELACAETMEKRIFPILARGNERDAIPFRLMSHQWVDARHNYNEAFEKLVGAVKKYLGVE